MKRSIRHRLAVAHLQQALPEADEIRAPGRIIRAALVAFAALALGLVVLRAIEAQFVLGDKPTGVSEQQLAKSGLADVEAVRSSRLPRFPARPVIHHRHCAGCSSPMRTDVRAATILHAPVMSRPRLSPDDR